MSLVGDAIIQAREVIPDMPQVLLPPGLNSVTPVFDPAGTFAPGTYYFQVTATNQWGESLPSAEFPVVPAAGVTIIAPNNAVQVNFALGQGSSGNNRLYVSFGSPGNEQVWIPFTSLGGVATVTGFSGAVAGQPPNRNTAWLPDTDGPLISAGAMFRWVNAGLRIIGEEAGGLQDYAGVPSVYGQPMYQIPGTWNKINDVWYDGYWLLGGDRGYFFRRNAITSQILSSATISVSNSIQIMEVYPQPARSGTLTTLAIAMGAGDTTCTLTTTNGFLLPFGFVQIDSEIMSYAAIQGNTLTGLIRALGGSPAVAHSALAPASELNLVFSGKRSLSNINYQPGSSMSSLPIPTGWTELLFHYLSGRAKLIEHDDKFYADFLKDMRDEIKRWAKTNGAVVGRRQVGPPSQPSVYYPTPGGGLIVP